MPGLLNATSDVGVANAILTDRWENLRFSWLDCLKATTHTVTYLHTHTRILGRTRLHRLKTNNSLTVLCCKVTTVTCGSDRCHWCSWNGTKQLHCAGRVGLDEGDISRRTRYQHKGNAGTTLSQLTSWPCRVWRRALGVCVRWYFRTKWTLSVIPRWRHKVHVWNVPVMSQDQPV